MRAPVQRNDAHVVDHLGQNHDMVVGLNDLIVVVVERGQHGRPAGDPSDAPFDSGHVFRPVMSVLAVILLIGFKLLRGFRRENAVLRRQRGCGFVEAVSPCELPETTASVATPGAMPPVAG